MDTPKIRLTPEEKSRKTSELMSYHKEVLDKIDYEVMYRPKRCYIPKGKDTKHISFFPSELREGKDIYTEFIDANYNSEDPTRTLYKWPYNPNWAEVYT